MQCSWIGCSEGRIFFRMSRLRHWIRSIPNQCGKLGVHSTWGSHPDPGPSTKIHSVPTHAKSNIYRNAGLFASPFNSSSKACDPKIPQISLRKGNLIRHQFRIENADALMTPQQDRHQLSLVPCSTWLFLTKESLAPYDEDVTVPRWRGF